MNTIVLLSKFDWPYHRQNPNNEIKEKSLQNKLSEFNCQSVVVVLEDLLQKENIESDNSILIFAPGEPESLSSYSKKFLSQFDIIIGPRLLSPNVKTYISRPLLPWFCGMRYDDSTKKWSRGENFFFENLYRKVTNQRENKVCIISSSKKKIPGHESRLKIITHLVNKMPNLIDVFGVGFCPIPDKFEVLCRYKYTLVIENSIEENYWTEKLLDAVISECAIFYVGCPNIDSYLDSKTILLIDSYDPKVVGDAILSRLNQNWYDQVIESIYELKKNAMLKYNIYNEIIYFINKMNIHEINKRRGSRILYPQRFYFFFLKKWLFYFMGLMRYIPKI
jgi:hypothetical protein